MRSPVPFWLDTADRPAPRPRSAATTSADLVVVGGGFSGLWTALLAKERDPRRDVVLVEAGPDRLGGLGTQRRVLLGQPHPRRGQRPRAVPGGVRAAAAARPRNLDEIAGHRRALRHRLRLPAHRASCTSPPRRTRSPSWRRSPAAVPRPRRDARRAGLTDLPRRPVDTPGETAMVDPARLAWGLAAAAESLGVRIVERTQSPALDRDGAGMRVAHRARDDLRAGRVALGTNAFPSLLRRTRLHTVPVYDYVLMTEPLTDQQLASIGWRNRQGSATSANQFHYYRLTDDNRILWGGYDAIYHFGRRVQPDERPAPGDVRAGWRALLRRRSPSSHGLRFSHRWGGAIDTCTRFCAFYGTGPRRPGRLRPRATPASGSGPPGSAPRSCSTCSTAPRHRAPGCSWCAEAVAVPAGAAGLGGHPADPLGPRCRRPPRRAPQPLAARARPAGLGFDS